MMRQPAPSCPPGLETIGASVVGTCRAAFAERGAVVRGCEVDGPEGRPGDFRATTGRY